jgi:heme-degrading monooxygenase HmoA
VYARVVSTKTTTEQLEAAVRIAHEQLPGARAQHGYRGLYVLTDRAAGTVLTISLWESLEDLQVVEARAAGIRETAGRSLRATELPVYLYQVEVADRG